MSCGCKFCNKCITKNFDVYEGVLICPKCNKYVSNLLYDTLPEPFESARKKMAELSEVPVNNASSKNLPQNVNVDKLCSDFNAKTVLSEQVCRYFKSLYTC